MNVQVADAKEYGYDAGFVIECLGFWNCGYEHYAMPDWTEWGYGEFDEVFATRAAAVAAIDGVF